MQQMTPQNIGAAIESAENIKCNCGCTTFTQGMELKKLSKLVSPTGQEEIITLPVFICSKCGKILRLDRDENETAEESGPKTNNGSLIL